MDVISATGGEVSADPQGSVNHSTVNDSPSILLTTASNSSGQIIEEPCGSDFENCYRSNQYADPCQNFNTWKQCPGDLKRTDLNANAQEIFEIFGNSVTFEFCIRALQQSNGNKDRAPNYIVEFDMEKNF